MHNNTLAITFVYRNACACALCVELYIIIIHTSRDAHQRRASLLQHLTPVHASDASYSNASASDTGKARNRGMAHIQKIIEL